MSRRDSQHSQHSYDPSEDNLNDGSESFRDSTLSSLESYALLPISPSIRAHPASDDGLSPPRVEEEQILRSNGRLYYVTVISIAGLVVHTLLLAFCWAFYMVTANNPLPLPLKYAMKARQHMQLVTLVVTLFASGISLLSVTLYGLAVQYALARRLATKLSLYELYIAFNLAKPSPIINLTRPGWMIASLLCVLAVNAQTAGYSILLTPKTIFVKSNMIGYELDLKNPDFQKLMEINAKRVTPENLFSRVLPVAQYSGGTAVSASFSLPGILTFNHFSYLNSTRGVLPVITNEADSKILSEYGTTMPINVEVEQKWSTPPGFPASFSMTQQGFTAHVTCQQLALNPIYHLSYISAANMCLEDINSTPTVEPRMLVNCPNGTKYSEPILTTMSNHAIFAVSCPVTETNGRKRWDLVLEGGGLYSSIIPTVCSIYPRLHAITINYNDNNQLFNSSSPKVINGTDPTDGEDASWLGDFALSVFEKGLTVGQSTTRNAMGDTVLSFMSTLPNRTDLLGDVLSQYVRGVLELSGTLLRTAYTQNGNGLYPGGASIIPPDMQIATNGTYTASTVGWHQATETAFGALAAPTMVSLVSIVVFLFTLLRKRNIKEPDANRYFNPCDVLHIISAASAGGMQRRFPPFHEDRDLEHCENSIVILAPVEGGNGRPGFINLN